MPNKQDPADSNSSLAAPARESPVASTTGVAVEQWRRFCDELIGEPVLTPNEVSRETGIEIERLRELWRALGFAPVPDDDKGFSQVDVEVLKSVEEMQQQEGINDEIVTQLARVSGQSLARIAETQVELFVARTDGTGIDDISSEAQRLTSIEPFLGYFWRRHLIAALGRKVVAGEDLSTENVLIVGFADLVGFTRMARHMEQSALAEVVQHFEQSVDQAVPQNNGRVIKMIGDEVMFAAGTPADSAEIALTLTEAHEADPILPEIRVGMSRGPVLSWEGDLYGATVNLASRLADAARPSTVLISSDLADELAKLPAYKMRRLRSMRLKGTGSVRAARLARAADTSVEAK